ncbi:fatty acid hydroxylase domain-containing protein 2-like isoform X1 [Montipora foliosa]|uniref:fatty acid hydroxylase domain-containing protein 2-like isoform X1 n=1 Tax=Montipora foliosa TaxID=591990 RepID=UPI0035F1839D
MTEAISKPDYPVLPEPEWAKPRDKNTPRNNKQDVIAALKKIVFVVGTALICFAAARNTITWHVERFWGASGDFWQGCWKKIHAFFGGDEFMLTVVGTNVVSFFVFWIFCALYLFVDLTGRPKWALQYKIQDGSNQPLDLKKLLKATKLVLFNQIVVGGGFSLALYKFYQWRGCSCGTELPSFQWVLFEIAIYSLVDELGFYYSHRLFHHPAIYRHIHKIHHEWTAPVGIVSIYAHPIEHLVANLLPVAMGPLIMGSHIATAWMWFTMALLTTINTHSGYHFPFMPSPEAHDFHHLKFTQNFGMLGVLDRLHGTDVMFRNSRAYDRHIMLLGFIPLKQTYPDDTKKGAPVKRD